MPFFRYQFLDPSGKTLEGTIQADSMQDAAFRLSQRGVRNPRVWPAADPNPTPTVAPPPVTVYAPGQAPSGPKVWTRYGSDKDRFFFFGQIARQLHAGINPVQVFDTLSNVTRVRHFIPSFREMSEAAKHGTPLSQVMERYPKLYPEFVAGITRAGEAGGFLPEAFDKMSEQANEAHKFKRWHWFIWYLVPRALAAIPLCMALVQALPLTWIRYDKEGGEPLQVFVRVLGEKILWPWGPVTLLVIGILLLLRWWLGTYSMTRFRHALGLKMPIYGPRARNECIMLFTWTLGKLARAGISPASSWALAAASVPNQEMKARLMDAGRSIESGSKFSDIVFQSRLFPQEYAPVLSTGELTGDIEGSLNQLADVSKTEFDVSANRARWGSARIGCVFALITSGIVCITFTWHWYNSFYGTILKSFTDEETVVK